MARLSIDIGVNLGDSTKQLGKLNSALIQLNSNADKLASSLKALGGIKATAQVNTKINQQVSQGTTGNISQPKLTPVPDIFADYRSGAIQAGTAIEYLEKKQADLLQESAKLKDALGKAVSGEQYQKLQNELNKTEKEINDVTKAINAQKAPVGGTAAAYGTLTKSTNLANLSVINFGRVLQDLPFGILGIANNLNPLVEGLKQLKDESKQAGTSVGTQLLNSLKGFGGITLAISAVSAALSFATIGLSYWTKNSKEAKENTDEFKEANKRLKLEEEQLKKQIDATNESISARSKITNYLKDITLTAAEAAGKSKEELRKLEDVLFKGESNLRTTADAFGNIQIVPSGLIAQAAQDREDAARQYVNAFSKIMMGLGATYDEIRAFERNYYNDAVSGFAKYSKNLNASQRQQIDILRKNYSDRQKAFEDINQRYNKIVADRALEDKKESDNLRKKAERAKTVEDIYKEINDDLQKIQKLSNLDPLQKASKSAERLKQGLDAILDFDITQATDIRFKGLEDKLRAFEELKIRFDVSQIKEDLNATLESLRQRGSFFNIDTTRDQIKAVETAIDKLYDKFQDKKVTPFEKQAIFLDIAILQNALRQLNLDFLVKSGESAFKELTQDAEKLRQKKILLGVSVGKEGLQLAKKSIDAILEKKIELLSEKDPVRAAQLNDELNKAQGVFSQFRSVAIGESFKEYQESARGIRQEFERTSKFLKPIQKLEYKIETDKKQLDLLTKQIQNQLDLGISPLDPRIIFERITQTKLKLQIEADTESLQQIQDQVRIIQDSLVSTFEGVGEAIGTSLAEGGNTAKAIGKTLLENLGSFLQQLGKFYITSSKLIQAANALFPFGGSLIAGVGLVALGALVKSFASKGFASGGFVSGPGSEHSDSIPARLSNGEFVVNAKSVRKYGRGFMEMVNNGSMPITNYKKNFNDLRFADGGLVMDTSRGTSRALVNRTDFGGGGFIAETKISGQDLKLILKRADIKYANAT